MLNEKQYVNPDKYQSRIYLNRKFSTTPGSKFKWIFKHFPAKEGLSILELGSGTGLFWLANRDNIPGSWSVTLSDYSSGMLEKTKDNLRQVNHDFKYMVINAEDIKYEDKSFDVVLANNMLYHVENRSKAISDIRRILKDDGVFIASTMGKRDMAELNRYLYDFLEVKNKNFKFSEFAFSLDNGLEQLEKYFSKIDSFRYEDMLKIDEVEPVINYYLSFNEMHDDLKVLDEKDVDGFRKFMQDILDSEKYISVTKDSGIFICSK